MKRRGGLGLRPATEVQHLYHQERRGWDERGNPRWEFSLGRGGLMSEPSSIEAEAATPPALDVERLAEALWAEFGWQEREARLRAGDRRLAWGDADNPEWIAATDRILAALSTGDEP